MGILRVDPGVEARALELAEGMARLSNKVDLAERFLANAAHEMKTPLANVRGELQLALMRERSADEYKGAIEAALSHTRAPDRADERPLDVREGELSPGAPLRSSRAT